MFDKKLFFIYIFLFSISFAMAQKEFDINIFHKIEKKCNKINDNLATYQKKSIAWDEAEEGAEGMAYFDGNQLKMYHIIWKGETGKNEIYYYFENNELIFQLEKIFHYNRPIYYSKRMAKEQNDTVAFDPEKTTILKQRYYFFNDKLVIWIDEHNRIIPPKQFGNKENQLRLEMKSLIKELRNKQ